MPTLHWPISAKVTARSKAVPGGGGLVPGGWFRATGRGFPRHALAGGPMKNAGGEAGVVRCSRFPSVSGCSVRRIRQKPTNECMKESLIPLRSAPMSLRCSLVFSCNKHGTLAKRHVDPRGSGRTHHEGKSSSRPEVVHGRVPTPTCCSVAESRPEATSRLKKSVLRIGGAEQGCKKKTPRTPGFAASGRSFKKSLRPRRFPWCPAGPPFSW